MAFCSFLIALSFAAPAYADDQTIHCKYDASSHTLFLGDIPFEGISPVEVWSLEMYGLELDGIDYASDISVVDFVNEFVPDEGISVAGMFDGCSVLTAAIHPENLKTGNSLLGYGRCYVRREDFPQERATGEGGGGNPWERMFPSCV